MKYTTLILLVLFCMNCKAQYPNIIKPFNDSNLIIHHHQPFIGDPIPIDTFNKYWKPYLDSIGFKYDTIPKYDTIKVIMLVCDTVSYRPISDVEKANGDRIVTDKNNTLFTHLPPVYWQYGYTVIESSQHIFIRQYYLDSLKNPLPKNIIVWMCK